MVEFRPLNKNLIEYRQYRSIVHALESTQDYLLSQFRSDAEINADIKKYRAKMDELREKGI